MLNHITIMGRLTRDPELRRTGNGVAVTSFTIAVDRDIKGNDGETDTDFIDCVAWRQTGEFVGKYFTKGRMAVVSGRLQIRGWTDKDGSKRRTAEVNADHVYFGDSKRSCRMIHLHRLPICPLLIRQPDTQRLLPILQCSKTMTHSCLSEILTDAAVNEVTRCACATIR